jgi:hypothetical protein
MSSRRLCVRFSRMGAVIAVGLLASCQTSCSRRDHFHAVSPVGCRISSWTPEVFSFYGDPDKVKGKLSRFDMKLAERRVYMFMAETADSADVVLFERPVNESGSWKVWRWKGQPLEARKFRETETDEILARQGKECVGQETEKLLEALNPVKQETNHPPGTALGAFSDVLGSYAKGSYIQATVFLLC